MIDYLYVNNYKTFVNFRIELDNVNLLLGKNGSGKSNILMLIASLRDLIQGHSNIMMGNAFSGTTLTRWMNSNIQTFELGFISGGHKYVYNLEISHDIGVDQRKIVSEKIICDGEDIYQRVNSSAMLHDDDSNSIQALIDPLMSGVSYVPQDGKYKRLQAFKDIINKIILCIPNPRAMDDTVQNDIYIPKVDFSNIASTYAGLLLLDPDIGQEIMRVFGDIDPSFRKIRISADGFFKHLRFDYQYDDVSCNYLISELSDGERMLFALYTLLFGFIKRDAIVLLDEPDNFISVREIQPWCMEMENMIDDGGQCILVSHHPEVIDYMAETRGVWIGRNKSGESRIISLSNIDGNKDLLTYSQIIARGLLDEVKCELCKMVTLNLLYRITTGILRHPLVQPLHQRIWEKML